MIGAGYVLREVQRALVVQLGAENVFAHTGREQAGNRINVFVSIRFPERSWTFVVEVDTGSTDAQVMTEIGRRLELEQAARLAEVLS